MNRALWLLLGLQMRGWLRSLTRRLATVRGAVLALVGLAAFLLWLTSVFLIKRSPSYTHDRVLEYGPAALLIYCLFNALSNPGERGVYFSPGEVNFLFAAPFGRRELLAYKIAVGFVFTLPSALFMTLVFQIYAHSFLAAFVGVLLILQFMQTFAMAVNLAASALETRLFTAGRRAAAVAAVVVAGAIVWQAGLTPGESVAEWLRKAAHTDLWRAVSTPLRYFFDAFLSENLWPDLAWNGLLALLVDVALVGVVFGLDVQYMEASAAVSARIYARLQRMRRVGPAASREGKARFGLPMLPWCGGAGPIFWRQLTTASRGAGRLGMSLVILGGVLAAVLGMGDGSEQVTLLTLLTGGAFMTTFLTTLAPFDFRGDVDQMALLKTLPSPAWRLALGQVLTPVLIFTLIHWIALAAVQWRFGRLDPLLLAGAAFAPLYNFVLVSVENLLFLLFPTRVMVTTPGDFQAMGRNVLSQLGKLLGVGGAALVAVLAGCFGYLVSGWNVYAGAATAWTATAVFAATLVPLMGVAFQLYDVGRDAPP